MAIGNAGLSNHHPIFHTAIISVFVNLGLKLFNDINVGIAFYSIASMVIMALLNSTVLQYLEKKGVNRVVRVIILLFYMFYPVNAMYSITMWKDVIFSGLVPLLIIVYIELLFNTKQFLNKKSNIASFIIISVLVILLRHNGIYIELFAIPFIMILTRKYYKKVIPMFIAIFLIYEMSNIFIYNILGAQKGSVVEMLSIPTQQIARTEKYHRDELSEETKQLINKFFICDQIGEKYNPVLSDNVKWSLDVGYFQEHKGEFIKLWLQLLIQHPKTYVESFLANSYGYYYVEAKNWVVARETNDNANHPMGIEQQPIIDGKLVSKIDSLIDKRDIPIVSMIFSVGFAFWLIVLCLAYRIYKKDYKSIIIYIPIFALWLTLIASPVFCEFRYAYPFFTTLPLYFAINLTNNVNRYKLNKEKI